MSIYESKFFDSDAVLLIARILTTKNLKEFLKIAKNIGLDSAKFDECLDSGKYAEQVKSQINEGQQAGVRGTPAFLINGELISGAQPFPIFQQAIEKILASG